MSAWNVRPGEAISPEKAKQIAHEVWKGLVFFNLVKTQDPAKKAALERLVELRLEVQKQLDVLAPGYMEPRGDVHEENNRPL